MHFSAQIVQDIPHSNPMAHKPLSSCCGSSCWPLACTCYEGTAANGVEVSGISAVGWLRCRGSRPHHVHNGEQVEYEYLPDRRTVGRSVDLCLKPPERRLCLSLTQAGSWQMH